MIGAIVPRQTKETRHQCALSVRDAGKLFRVSERTIRNWEAARVGIPYAAFKLMRILRGYELPGQPWKGYRLIGDTLWSPENKPFRAADARWWSLTACMANEFRRMVAGNRAASVAAGQAAGAQAGAPVAKSMLQSGFEVGLALDKRPTPPPVAIDPPQYAGGNALRVWESPSSNTGFVAFAGKPESLLQGVQP